jgi:predicted nuclease of predicted toxin-antitoxin system
VKFLVDENLSPKVAAALSHAGHDAIHVGGLGLMSAPDEAILEAASSQERVVISADTDFGTLMAETQAPVPSVILIRRISNRRADELSGLILANLHSIADALEQGAVVVVEETRIRVRGLPLV